MCKLIHIHYIAKRIGSPSSNERFDYFSHFHGSCPNCCYKIRSTQFHRITLRFVLMEIINVVKPFIRKG